MRHRSTKGEGVVTVTTEDYCAIPQMHWHGNCVTLECGDVVRTTCF